MRTALPNFMSRPWRLAALSNEPCGTPSSAAALVGPHRALMLVRAGAHALLGERREEEQAYRDWLEVAGDHAERPAVLIAQERVLEQLAIEDEERALGIDGRSRSLVRLGLEEARDILTEAVRAAREVKDESLRAWTFANIAGVQAKAGDARGAAQSLSDARAAARGVEDEHGRARAFANIAEALVTRANDAPAASKQ